MSDQVNERPGAAAPDPAVASGSRKPFKGLSPEWEDFGLCMMFHLLLPLLPLAVEYFAVGKVTGPSVTMASAMYVIAVGSSSKSRLLFGICIVLCILFSVAYGLLHTSPSPSADQQAIRYSGVALTGIFLVHSLERYNRHVVNRTPYWEF